MHQFIFHNTTKVLFGPGQLSHLHEQKLPGKKALLATSNGTSVKKYGYLDAVVSELKEAGVDYVLFDEIRANPTNHNVMDGAAKSKENGCDFVLALGGGSVMDCAKCIAMMATNPGDLWDYSFSAHGGRQKPTEAPLPLVCITTSAGTASEVDAGAVISNDETNEKTAVSFPFMLPFLSVVDAELMKSVPPTFTAWQGMDAFFHASETVINKDCHPMAEMFALKTIELVAAYLPRAVKDGNDMEAREMMAYANSFAGYYMMCTSVHRMEHAMGSFHEKLAHGAGLIMISPAYYDFMAKKGVAEEALCKMARAMGVEKPASGQAFVDALCKLIEDIDCGDLKMSDYGITEEEIRLFPDKIHQVLGGNIKADPVPLSQEDYLAIYQQAYR